MIADLCEIDLALKLLPSSNSAPPRDLQLVAKVVTGGDVVAESNTMSAGSENSWMLKVKSELWVNISTDRIFCSCIVQPDRLRLLQH
jgi:hypothetical protein